jgi:pimeloyl-ACP methyl ester carboxylesterase
MRGSPDTADRWIELKDGRKLGYAAYGDPDGEPTVYFPGSPGNRLNPFLDAWGRETGIRFLSVDRPGYGLSTPQPDRPLADLGHDIAELAHQVGLERFSLAGVSGGGPAVLGCAYTLGERIVTSVIISGVAPPQAPRDGLSHARIKAQAAIDTDAERYGRQMGIGLWVAAHLPASILTRAIAKGTADTPAADRELLARPDIRDLLVASARSMGRGEGRAAAAEMRQLSRPWGFDLGDVPAHVRLWHGSADTSVPIGAARFVAEHLPDGHLSEVPRAGHLLLFDRWRDIFTGLSEAARSRSRS